MVLKLMTVLVPINLKKETHLTTPENGQFYKIRMIKCDFQLLPNRQKRN